MWRIIVLCLFAGCQGSVSALDAGKSPDASSDLPDASATLDAGFFDAGGSDVPDAAVVSDSGLFDAGVGSDSGVGIPDAGSPDAGAIFCNGQKLCDNFESYAASDLTNGMTLGPWRVVLDTLGTASIDSSRSFSGTHSLKVHINNGTGGGAQLRTQSNKIFSPARPQLYGKFRMYMTPTSGHSVHWTMFGAAGIVQPPVPISGHHVTYLFSAFTENMKNVFSNVFYDDQTRQDCYHNSKVEIPLGRWACVAFSVDGPGIKYRGFLDGQPVPTWSIDTTGDGCLNAAQDAPWYGPSFDEFYVGALSFHKMSAALDMWIDDVVLDTNPVNCE
jgi:hypothetical protein